MTEGEAQKKIDILMIIINEVWDRFDKNFFDGREIYSAIKELSVLTTRFCKEIEERNGNNVTENVVPK